MADNYEYDEVDETEVGCGDGAAVIVMPAVIVQGLIRRMGVSGGGMNELARCQDVQQKKRFWAAILQHLRGMGYTGVDPSAVVRKWSNLSTKFKDACSRADKSGAGGKHGFHYFNLMKEEVGHHAKFNAVALCDSSSGSGQIKIVKVNKKRRGSSSKLELRRQEVKIDFDPSIAKADSTPDSSGSASDSESSTASSNTHHSRNKSNRNELVREIKKSRKLMRKMAAETVEVAKSMKDVVQQSIVSQENFNVQLLEILRKG